jgi:hypothetical protein
VPAGVAQFVSLRETLGVERTPPRGEDPTANPDADHDDASAVRAPCRPFVGGAARDAT